MFLSRFPGVLPGIMCHTSYYTSHDPDGKDQKLCFLLLFFPSKPQSLSHSIHSKDVPTYSRKTLSAMARACGGKEPE